MIKTLEEYTIKTNKKNGISNKLQYVTVNFCFIKLGENSPELKSVAEELSIYFKHFTTVGARYSEPTI